MSERDELDELAGALFAAAWRERPSDEARARGLEVLRSRHVSVVEAEPKVAPRSSRRPVYVALTLAAAALVAVLVIRARREVTVVIGPEAPSARHGLAEPTPPAPTTSEQSAVTTEPEHAVRRSAPARDLSSRKPLAPVASAPARPPATLSEEVTTLDRARSALNGGDAVGALEVLDGYDQVLHGTRLAEEATLLRVEALSRSGRADAAARLARHFIETNPGSPLAQRARAFAGVGTGATNTDAGGMK